MRWPACARAAAPLAPSLPLTAKPVPLHACALPAPRGALRPRARPRSYGGAFLGMLEDPADGLGAWGTAVDMTAFGIACNATFSSVAKLVAGGYGARPTQPGHTLLAANPEWTGPDDIGQFWERCVQRRRGCCMLFACPCPLPPSSSACLAARAHMRAFCALHACHHCSDLKRTAAQLLAPGSWATLYDARMVRTSRGRGHGLLVGSWSAGWHLWPAESGERRRWGARAGRHAVHWRRCCCTAAACAAESSSVADECVLWSPEEPPLSDVVDALNAAAEARGAAKK